MVQSVVHLSLGAHLEYLMNISYDPPSETTWLNSERPDVGSTHATETFWNPEIPAEEGQWLLAVAKCFRTPTDVDRIVFGLSEVITVVSLCGGFNTI